MRQFRDLSDIVGLWKADKLDRQNPIQSSTAEFFEITTSVSFHECARGSIYYPYIPRRCFTSGKGIDRSRGVCVAAWMRFELQKLTSRRDSLVIEYKMQFFKSLRTAVSRTSASLRPPVSENVAQVLRVCSDRIYERIPRCLYGDRAPTHLS